MDVAERNAIHAAIVRLSDGDRSAVVPLATQLWPVLLAFARQGLRHEADAEDVAQESFLKLCANASDFDASRDGLSWAFGIAKYEIMSHRRREQRRRESSGGAQLATVEAIGASQEAELLERDLQLALERALGELTPAERALFALERDETDPGGVRTAAVRKRKQRALERLRSVWRRLYGES
jgi:RNA polymerase sigma-70 factor (ECF subfamily)